MHDHDHRNPFTENLFEYRRLAKKKLVLSLAITIVFMLVELLGGILTGSISLISDAGHMFTHAFAIGIGLVAIFIARKPPCHHRTFGLFRAEILAAFINGLFLLLVVGIIIFESTKRIIEPREVLGFEMFVVAVIGLFANLIGIAILHGSHTEDLNVKGVFYHLLADAASSVGVVIAAVIISYTGFTIIDPLVSIGISLVILSWAVHVLKESGMILMEMAPAGFDSDTIAEDLKATFPDIRDIRNAHLWAITPDMLVFSAHILLAEKDIEPDLIKKIGQHLKDSYRVIESTIQIITDEEDDSCALLP
jgi:cobalt-zinc-cadmium efflux system protein